MRHSLRCGELLTLRLIQPDTPRDVYSFFIDGYLFLPSLIVGLNRFL